MPDILDILAAGPGGSLDIALFGGPQRGFGPGGPGNGGAGPAGAGRAGPGRRGGAERGSEDRAIDGSGNNPADGSLGAAGTPFVSQLAPGYEDGFGSPSGAGRPNARTISNEIFAQDAAIDSSAGASNMLWMWGQFLDHDIDLTEGGSGESFDIAVPTGDPWFDPYATGTQSIAMERSAAAAGTGTDMANPRLQVNEITAFIDASNVYGSDAARAAALRADGGYLKVSAGDLLPYNNAGLDNANANPFLETADLFLAGDVRANENVGLTAMHTIFVREHNRIVDGLSQRFPGADGDTLYQSARAIVEAEIQSVTYNEFLPLLVGQDALGSWQGYRADIDPQIANEFATAAFRIGHSMLSSSIARIDENGAEAAGGNLALRDAFFNPAALAGDGVEGILRGQAASLTQEIDTQVVDDVRNFLFGPPGSGGFDLVSLNIQRGRDHGLTDYNSVREAYGLSRIASFQELTSDAALAARLQALYGSIDEIDLYVGGLAEDAAPGALVGETFQAILVQQFVALRDGDRFWYEGRLSPDLVAGIEATSLSDIVLRNSDIDYLQDDLFLASNRIGGSEGADLLAGTAGRDLLIGLAGSDRLSGEDGADEIYGGAGSDTLSGGAGDDWLQADNDADSLDGGRGADSLYGNAGDDSLDGGDGADFLHGGVGADSLDGGDGDDLLVGMWQADTLSGGAGDDSICGNLGDDWLDGGEGADSLHGGTGRDSLLGGSGDDMLIGLYDDDSLQGEAGDDWIVGNLGNDSLDGGDGDDFLFGGTGSDRLDGGAGNDTLRAMDGADSLTGGEGADIFAHLGPRAGSHVVTDYDAAEGDSLLFEGRFGPVQANVSGTDLLVTDARGTLLFTVEGVTEPTLLDIGYI